MQRICKKIISAACLWTSVRHWRLHPLSLVMGVWLGGGVHPVWAKDYFDPAFLNNDGQSAPVDLAAFESEGNIVEGNYLVDIYLNQKFMTNREVRFSKNSAGMVRPELTPTDLGDMGVGVSRIPLLKDLPPTEPVNDVSSVIPHARTDFDQPMLRLNISVPQADMDKQGGTVDPKLWDNGIPAILLNYNINGSKSWSNRQDFNGNNFTGGTQNLFSSVNGGVNAGPWRLRSWMTYSSSSSSTSGQSTNSRYVQMNNTYLQRDVQALRGSLSLGEISTGGDIFDSIPFRGAKLVSNTDMLPQSQRGFAPVLSGIANSNALITVTQHGNVIYQTNVAPGPFRISDITSVGSAGDLVMTVTEEDGSQHVSTQAYSTLPVMQRPGGIEYEVSMGRFYNGSGFTNGSRTPPFVQGTLVYGLPNYTSLYGGLVASSDYQSLALGTGLSLGHFGAFSADVLGSKTTLPGQNSSSNGAAFRARYSKSMLTTGTTFDLAAYRYATKNFYSFVDANTAGYQLNTDLPPWLADKKRSSWQINLTQRLDKWGAISLRGNRDEYWGSERVITGVSAGFGSSIKGIGYNISYNVSRRESALEGTWPIDRQMSLSVSVPFSLFSTSEQARSMTASYTMNRDTQGRVSNSTGIGGGLFDGKASWNASQGWNNQGEGSSGNLGIGYSGTVGNMSIGYGYSKGSRTVNASMMGGMVVHRNGVVLSPSLGDSVALISAPGAAGVKVSNGSSRTNRWGYAVTPYIQNYQRNVITLDPSTLPDGADILTSSVNVYPTKGAVVEAKFKTRIGQQAMLVLNYAGKPVPFGAVASINEADGQHSSIVGDSGMVYLSGLPQTGEVSVQWGRAADQQCKVSYDLSAPGKKDAEAVNIVQKELICQ